MFYKLPDALKWDHTETREEEILNSFFFGAFDIRTAALGKIDGSDFTTSPRLRRQTQAWQRWLQFNAEVVVMRDFYAASMVSDVRSYADLLDEYIYSSMFLFFGSITNPPRDSFPSPEHLLLYLSVLFLILFCSKIAVGVIKVKKAKKKKNVKLVDF